MSKALAKRAEKREQTDAANQLDSESQAVSADIREQVERVIGEVVPGKAKEVVVSRVEAIIRQETFKGPIPHPRHLEAYEGICPGSADRIISMAEQTLAHNIAVSQKDQNDEAEDRRLGMWLGFFSFLALIVCAGVAAMFGQQVLAGLFLGAGVLGVVTKFIAGRNGGKPQPD